MTRSNRLRSIGIRIPRGGRKSASLNPRDESARETGADVSTRWYRKSMGTQGFEPLSTGFSHEGGDPLVVCEPLVSAPVFDHRNHQTRAPSSPSIEAVILP